MSEDADHPGQSPGVGHGYDGALVDVDTGILREGHLLLLNGASGGYVSLALGAQAGRLFRFAFFDDADPYPFFETCRRIEAALDDNDLAKAQRLGLPAPLPAIADGDLRRLAIAELLVKAGFNPDEPRDEHGRWTTGGVGQGNLSEQLTEIAARRLIRIFIGGAIRFGGDALLTLVPGIGEILGSVTLGDIVVFTDGVWQLKTDASAAAAFAQDAPWALDNLRLSADDESFSSFVAFKKSDDPIEKRFGSAGSGYQYHHIVEQGGANAGTIPAEVLNSTENIIRLPTLVHELINAIYSGDSDEAPGLTVRQWLRTQSYQQQFDYGLRVLRNLGIIK